MVHALLEKAVPHRLRHAADFAQANTLLSAEFLVDPLSRKYVELPPAHVECVGYIAISLRIEAEHVAICPALLFFAVGAGRRVPGTLLSDALPLDDGMFLLEPPLYVRCGLDLDFGVLV